MSATSNKSRLLLFLMVVISLVFFITSFLTAAFTGGTVANSGQQQATAVEGSNCLVVRTGEGMLLADCTFR